MILLPTFIVEIGVLIWLTKHTLNPNGGIRDFRALIMLTTTLNIIVTTIIFVVYKSEMSKVVLKYLYIFILIDCIMMSIYTLSYSRMIKICGDKKSTDRNGVYSNNNMESQHDNATETSCFSAETVISFLILLQGFVFVFYKNLFQSNSINATTTLFFPTFLLLFVSLIRNLNIIFIKTRQGYEKTSDTIFLVYILTISYILATVCIYYDNLLHITPISILLPPTIIVFCLIVFVSFRQKQNEAQSV
ncbi:hypothetical protein EON71_00540 [bacterium]|nr:MAG: hypothetical protein EON71_00540 [bacterium]